MKMKTLVQPFANFPTPIRPNSCFQRLKMWSKSKDQDLADSNGFSGRKSGYEDPEWDMPPIWWENACLEGIPIPRGKAGLYRSDLGAFLV